MRPFALVGRGRLFAFGQGLAHSLMLPRLARKPDQPGGASDATTRPEGRARVLAP